MITIEELQAESKMILSMMSRILKDDYPNYYMSFTRVLKTNFDNYLITEFNDIARTVKANPKTIYTSDYLNSGFEKVIYEKFIEDKKCFWFIFFVRIGQRMSLINSKKELIDSFINKLNKLK